MRRFHKHKWIQIWIVIAALALLFTGCSIDTGDDGPSISWSGLLSSTEDIDLHDVDGGEMNYAFTYDGEEFRTQYIYDCWTVYDSYKITNEDDQQIICQALIDTHTVHGSDMESFRTADDMAYEWQQHNLAYKYLPEDNVWRESARNVDFDPEDQGRSFEEIYEDRTGKEFDLEKYIREKLDDGDLVEELKQFLR